MGRKIVLAVTATLLFLIPNLLWGNLYIVGGDDARLYFLYPLEYLTNHSFSVIIHNTLGGTVGYWPVSYNAPTIAVLWVLRHILPAINVQLFMYGLIISGGFLFMYLFLGLWISKRTTFVFLASVVSSLFYVLSPYITKTYWQHQIISIYLIAVVPGTLYFLVRGIRHKATAYIIVSALLFSLFSSTVYSLPWLLPVIFTLSPFFIWLGIRRGKYFWKALGIWILVLAVTNAYWIVHYLIPIFVRGSDLSVVGQITSPSFAQANDSVITALTYLNSPVHQIIGFLRTGWQQRPGPGFLESLGGLYLAVIFAAGVALKRAGHEARHVWVISLCGLILALLYITPNFGDWNLTLFQFFNDHIPLFALFRNMYDKFALAMAFNGAFALFASIVVLTEAKVNARMRLAAVTGVFLVLVITAVPYIRPVYNDSQYSIRITESLNENFLDLTGYVKGMKTTQRFLWLPMTFPGYVFIPDSAGSSHFYTGISPLQILAHKSDIAGFYGLQTPLDPELNWKVLDLLTSHKYTEIGNILENQNIGFIIVNREQIPAAVRAYFGQFNFLDVQTKEFYDTILGEKVRDFGPLYTLYRINKNFTRPTVFLDNQEIPVPYSETADGDYEITLPRLVKPATLVFLQPYSRFWQLPGGLKHTPAYGYGNAWELPAGFGGNMTISFWPNRLTKPALVLSIFGFVASVLCCVLLIIKKK